jgi:predicted transcriptional regulator
LPEKRGGITIVTSVRLNDALDARVEAAAAALGKSKHAIMVRAIERGLPDVEREADDWRRFQASRDKPPKAKR